MKKILIYALVLLMAFSGVSAAFADSQGIHYDYNQLTVGSATPFSGNFFAKMWGNLTSDLDVQMLIHGCSLVEWDSEQGAFVVDDTVVSGIVPTEDENGDRTYSIMIYDDLAYSDGTPITAWDYAFSILLSIAPQIAEIGGNPVDLDYIRGYREYVRGEASELTGVRVLNDLLLKVTIRGDYLPFFYELGLFNITPYPISVIAPGCQVKDDGQGVYIANVEEDAEPAFTAALLRETILDEATGYLSHPAVSSGPYRLVSYDGQQVELEINEHFKCNFKGITPTIPRLVYRTLEKGAMIDLLSSGEVGLLNKCLSADTVQAGLDLVEQNKGAFAVTSYPRTGLGFIAFCCEQPTVGSLAVRQAVSYCFDKDAVAGETVSEFGERVDGYYGVGQWMYQLVSGAIAYPVQEPALGATEEEIQAYEAELQKWQDLTLDDVPVYDVLTDEAVRLLTEDGWTLNRQGEPFGAGTDDVRCKKVDGQLVALDLTMLCPEENGMADELAAAFAEGEKAGIRVTVKSLPMQEVLRFYYREQARDCDMIFMASNFDMVFDPSITFMPDRLMPSGEETNHANFSAIDDEELYVLAAEMRQTEPEDLWGYCEKWIGFQTRMQDVVPIISIYSSLYYDFYPQVLHDYDVSSSVSWGQAIVGAYMSDLPTENPGSENVQAENGEVPIS